MPLSPKERIDQLNKIAALVNKKTFTKEDGLKFLEAIIKRLIQLEKNLIDRLEAKTKETEKELGNRNREYIQVITKAKREGDSTFQGIRRRMMERVNSLFVKNEVRRKLNEILLEADNKIKEIDERMSQVRSGRDADEKKVAAKASKLASDELKALIPTLDTSEDIANKLELLQGDKRLKVEAIDKLEDRLKELENRPVGRLTGAGVGKLALEAHFIDDETPSGTVNGTNTDFELTNKPNPPVSLKVYVNGMKMKLTDDYSLSGTTITFVTAPPTGSLILVDYRT